MLVYLDIDGVMIPVGQDPNIIPTAMSARLRTLLNATAAKLVISSHRRRSKDPLLALLAAAGFGVSDLAPFWSTDLNIPDLDDDHSIRGQEIACHVTRHEVRDYVILDDCPCLQAQASRQVQTIDRLGLVDADVEAAIKILNRLSI